MSLRVITAAGTLELGAPVAWAPICESCQRPAHIELDVPHYSRRRRLEVVLGGTPATRNVALCVDCLQALAAGAMAAGELGPNA